MWQGWKDEEQRRIRIEQEYARLANLFKRVVKERDDLREELDNLKNERDGAGK
jgi:hypothetical protein